MQGYCGVIKNETFIAKYSSEWYAVERIDSAGNFRGRVTGRMLIVVVEG